MIVSSLATGHHEPTSAEYRGNLSCYLPPLPFIRFKCAEVLSGRQVKFLPSIASIAPHILPFTRITKPRSFHARLS